MLDEPALMVRMLIMELLSASSKNFEQQPQFNRV
jgi:hypothetical protein